MSTEKSPVRIEIERQILAALSESDRPMTLRELAPIADAAEGPQQLARILGYMRRDGMIVNGPEVQPGEPGGLSGKGARVVASYWLSQFYLTVMQQDIEPMTNPEPAILQGKSADIDLIAALKMSAAEDDDGEACLDAADASHNSDEFEWTPEMIAGLNTCADNFDFERDVLELREIAEQAALDAADALIRGSHLRAWEAVQRLHRAVTTFTSDYV